MIQAEEYAFMEHIWVIQAPLIFAILCLKEEYKCRVEAINALTIFCFLQEARCPCRPKPSALDIRLKQDVKLLSIFDLPGLLDSILIKYKATQYIFCLSKEKLLAIIHLKFFYNCGNLKNTYIANIFNITLIIN